MTFQELSRRYAPLRTASVALRKLTLLFWSGTTLLGKSEISPKCSSNSWRKASWSSSSSLQRVDFDGFGVLGSVERATSTRWSAGQRRSGRPWAGDEGRHGAFLMGDQKELGVPAITARPPRAACVMRRHRDHRAGRPCRTRRLARRTSVSGAPRGWRGVGLSRKLATLSLRRPASGNTRRSVAFYVERFPPSVLPEPEGSHAAVPAARCFAGMSAGEDDRSHA